MLLFSMGDEPAGLYYMPDEASGMDQQYLETRVP
jgi:hypothetical protein